MHVRICRECGEEFRPGTSVCSDCGGALEDRFLDEDGNTLGGGAGPTPPASEGGLPPSSPDLMPVVRGALSDEIATMTSRLAAEDLPFAVGGSSAGFDLLVSKKDFGRAREALAELLPPPPAHDESACPACGRAVSPGTAECPECGLVLGEEPVRCEGCGAVVATDEQACPQCGRGTGE
jgi:RNA polymerase subunit RPABC4/transcription elongation factor Spt4